MPEWVMQLLLAVIGAGGLSGVGWLFKTRHDDRVARELAYATEIKALQQEVKDLLQDRIKYEMVRRESSDQTMKVLTELVGLLKAGKGLPP